MMRKAKPMCTAIQLGRASQKRVELQLQSQNLQPFWDLQPKTAHQCTTPTFNYSHLAPKTVADVHSAALSTTKAQGTKVSLALMSASQQNKCQAGRAGRRGSCDFLVATTKLRGNQKDHRRCALDQLTLGECASPFCLLTQRCLGTLQPK